jgi:hypothetical protein
VVETLQNTAESAFSKDFLHLEAERNVFARDKLEMAGLDRIRRFVSGFAWTDVIYVGILEYFLLFKIGEISAEI